ncbi:cytokinin hydroxylase [Cryptomeria japonica]|uniref:cytokinin hydroxylase n=1 Tax=Cryptomeria japonica TaxID=3369 RepID=UPI0027DAAEEA|nr:cytokinin hydroxylase [Cryptomeria japonica]
MDLLKAAVNTFLVVVLVTICPFFAGFVFQYLWRPWIIYRALQKQGFKGHPPRFMIGDFVEIGNLVQQQMLTDLPSISHDIRNRIFPYIVNWSQRYGEKFVIWFGYEPRIVLTDAELIRDLLSSKYSADCGRSPMIIKMLSVGLGNGLFTVNGQRWSHQRRIVAPAFHMEKLKASVDIMSMCTNQLVKEWNEIMKEAAEGPCELELTAFLDRLTADIFMRIGFGMDYSKGGKEIYEDIRGLEEIMNHNIQYLWLPGSSYIPTPSNLEAWKRRRRLENSLKQIIEKRKESGSFGDDLLGLILSEVQNVSSDEKNSRYTEQQVIDECKTFFLGGRETTSVLITWAILLLALNQDWQQKAHEEATAICGNKNPTMDCLGKLKIIGMILNETLRLYPPGVGVARQAFKELKLRDDFIIPKGVNVVGDILAVNRDPKYWGSDANEFRPERFRDGISKATNNHPYAFIPFSSGPRVCIGQNYALLEAKVLITMLVKKFRFSVSSGYRHAPVAFITLNPQHGMPIMVERIECNGD